MGEEIEKAGRINWLKEETKSLSGKNFLLVIAINDYHYCPKLNNCIRDAQGFVKVLTERYYFDEENFYSLYNADATKENIHIRLGELKKKIRPEDNLIIYFSGHGETKDQVGFWVPIEAHPDKDWEFISTHDIKSKLNVINSFHTFVIVDACFSGSLFVNYRSVKFGDETKKSRLGLSASHSGERALDGTPGQHSPFAQVLLKKLKENQENLSVNDLASEVIKEVKRITQQKQTPVFRALDLSGDDLGQFIFRIKENEESFWSICLAKPTMVTFSNFLQKFPQGRYANEALNQLQKLESKEFKIWDTAEKSNLISNYILYIQQFPQGKYAEEARIRIQFLEDQHIYLDQLSISLEPVETNLSINKHFGQYTDRRDGQIYRTINLGGLTWFVENLNYETQSGSWIYDDTTQSPGHGRLYTWEVAQIACPQGWRLPTVSDWRKLLKGFKGREFEVLTNREFNIRLGGYRNLSGVFQDINRNGYYWSSTESGSTSCWGYIFNDDLSKIYHEQVDKKLGFCCRCVQ